jgi:large subunit ribosomal protein L18
MAVRKEARRAKLRKKIRSKISGTATKPRLSVFRSNKAIYAQVIDDSNGTTIVSASSATLNDKVTKVEASTIVGKTIAEKAITAGITEVVFDRGGYLYHGRIKSLADGAREGGLKF